jgi:glycosyltransferase involved in cell wall biosynthesis
MKICVISTPVFRVPTPGYSGLEHLAWQQAAGLAAKGHEVALVAPEGSTCPGVTIIPNGQAGTWDEKAAYNLYWQYLPQFDITIDDSWQKWAFILKEEGKLKAPILGVMHAPVNTMYQTLPPVEKPSMVCISIDQGHHFMALHGRRCEVAYNGVDVNFYKKIEGLSRNDRLLFLARFSTIKGPDLAIAVAKATGKGLDLVGDDTITNEPDYLNMIKANCDGTQVVMRGPSNRGECVSHFSTSFLMLHPNQRFREPFGLAPVEAMACQLPVIAWRHGAVQETIIDNHTGWLCSSLEEMVSCVHRYYGMSENDRNYMAEQCRTRAMDFSVDRMINRYEELCKIAIETGGW